MVIIEFSVVHPQLMKDAGKHVRRGEAVFCNRISDVVRGPVGQASLETSAREEQTAGPFVMVATRTILGNRQTSKLAAP